MATLECPTMLLTTFKSLPLLAAMEQNVCRKEWKLYRPVFLFLVSPCELIYISPLYDSSLVEILQCSSNATISWLIPVALLLYRFATFGNTYSLIRHALALFNSSCNTNGIGRITADFILRCVLSGLNSTTSPLIYSHLKQEASCKRNPKHKPNRRRIRISFLYSM